MQYDTGIKIVTVEPKEFLHVNRSMSVYIIFSSSCHTSVRQSTLMFNSSFHNKSKCDVAASFFKGQPATKTIQ